ncbi:MAG: hypothetical protein JRI68_33920, partial [Deltaproteobacteria bacterium]|nr:hypothetical protein [Deltaproteobacteria bacterium]
PPGAPADWSSPDDYYDGTWEIRFEIFEQATSRTSNLQVCIWVTGGNETCSPHTPVNGPGNVATSSTSPSTWWTMSGPVDFAHPEIWDRLGMPLWNDEPCVVSDWSSSFCWDDRVDYFPMRIRLTVVAVSAGSTFSGWDSYILAPTVQITEPADGAVFAPGSTIQIEATAEASYASIAQVDFLQGTTLMESDTDAPYLVNWANVAEGTYTVTARAMDTFDATSEDPITFTVGAGGSGTGGGAGGTGGTTSSGGGVGGGGTAATTETDDDDGCGCRTVGGRAGWPAALLWLAPWLVLSRRRGPTAKARQTAEGQQ